MRRPSLFKERDVTRATRAVLAAGLHIARVEISREGAIAVIPGKSEKPSKQETEGNEWDEGT
jgi:hypothetical protein